MATPYQKLKIITDRYYSGETRDWASDAIKILTESGIRKRDKDGRLVEVNFSIPTSKRNCFVLGLRYEKNDGSDTEDLFLFKPDKKEVESFYKGRLGQMLGEYQGTHKSPRNADLAGVS